MKDKEKQSEEMAKEIMKPQDCKGYEDNRGCYFSNGKGCDKCKIERYENAQIMADHLYNLGYRKLPEDSVVLSREEYTKNLNTHYYMGQREVEEEYKTIQIPQARKETAEKILKLVFKHITTLKVWEELQHNTWLSKGGNFTANKHIWDLLLEPIAKQLGVEIKE